MLADWFSSAVAAGFPCATAQLRRTTLVAPTAAALASGQAVSAGQALAAAVAGYLAGHSFGSGVSGPPLALPVATNQTGQIFADLTAPVEVRANRMATVLVSLARSTPVAFPSPPWAGVVM